MDGTKARVPAIRNMIAEQNTANVLGTGVSTEVVDIYIYIHLYDVQAILRRSGGYRVCPVLYVRKTTSESKLDQTAVEEPTERSDVALL